MAEEQLIILEKLKLCEQIADLQQLIGCCHYFKVADSDLQLERCSSNSWTMLLGHSSPFNDKQVKIESSSLRLKSGGAFRYPLWHVIILDVTATSAADDKLAGQWNKLRDIKS